jgi:peptide deformylase
VAAGVDLENRRVEIEGTGLLARCFQHEIDHLDGHLYIDRLDAENRKRALKIIRNRQISATE